MKKYIVDGICADLSDKTVWFESDKVEHTDPILDKVIIPGLNTWSIFKRGANIKRHGNPYIYALKNEHGWKFRSNADKELIENRFNVIVDKFCNIFSDGIIILMPSSSNLNRYIADAIADRNKNAMLLEHVIVKLTTEEVEDIVLDLNSNFRKVYDTEESFNDAYQTLCRYLDEMDEKAAGCFTRHYIKDDKMLKTLDCTLKLSTDRYAEYANVINDANVLIIDDTISRGQTVKEAVDIIKKSYAPKSITVLTLLSSLYGKIETI